MKNDIAESGPSENPTQAAYDALMAAQAAFNEQLFDGKIPLAVISFQRYRGAYGYFAGKRFGSRDGADERDEIAMNPQHFETRTDAEILSTLLHEMCHAWQHHFGHPSRAGYHNREWAAKMKAVGLQPDNGSGRETGQAVSHRIITGGPFSIASAALLEAGRNIRYIDLWRSPPSAPRKLKSKYSCPTCRTNVWGRPGLFLICGDCITRFAEIAGPEETHIADQDGDVAVRVAELTRLYRDHHQWPAPGWRRVDRRAAQGGYWFELYRHDATGEALSVRTKLLDDNYVTMFIHRDLQAAKAAIDLIGATP